MSQKQAPKGASLRTFARKKHLPVGDPGHSVTAVRGLTCAPGALRLGPSGAGLQTRTWVQEFTYKEIPEESQGLGRDQRRVCLLPDSGILMKQLRAPPGTRGQGCTAPDAHSSLAGA